jgi:D-lactate dehydrogenase
MGQPYLPSALEFLDVNALALLRSHYPDMLPADSDAMLMIEVDGSAQDVANAQAAIAAACQTAGLIDVATIAQPAALWAARKALSPLLRDVAPKKINEDVVVPVSRLPELLSGVARIVAEHGVRNVNFGHAGNGNIHVNLLINPADPGELSRGELCLQQVFDLVISLNGALSGEHGVGQEKRDFVPLEMDVATLALQRQIKLAFDPHGLLNPGKVLPE